jgi:antitoxin (DNA-binding transcriptional repressor) of toxin-antitoxin stability system
MKQVTITVSDKVAAKLVQLARKGRVSGNAGYKAFELVTEHARPVSTRSYLREIVVDGVTYVAPSTLSYGRF